LVYFRTEKLSDTASDLIEQTVTNEESVYLSAISMVEIYFLIERNRLPEVIWNRLNEAMSQANSIFELVPLNQAVSLCIPQISRSIVPEMPDRIIAATALHLNLPLITRDHKIQALANIQTLW
jgi:PIN domain nuclease of toxin-antitoxin system